MMKVITICPVHDSTILNHIKSQNFNPNAKTWTLNIATCMLEFIAKTGKDVRKTTYIRTLIKEFCLYLKANNFGVIYCSRSEFVRAAIFWKMGGGYYEKPEMKEPPLEFNGKTLKVLRRLE